MSLADDVKAPIRHADRFFIGGQWVRPSSDATITVIDSGTEEVYFSVAEAQADRHLEGGREGLLPFLETKTVILERPGPPGTRTRHYSGAAAMHHASLPSQGCSSRERRPRDAAKAGQPGADRGRPCGALGPLPVVFLRS